MIENDSIKDISNDILNEVTTINTTTNNTTNEDELSNKNDSIIKSNQDKEVMKSKLSALFNKNPNLNSSSTKILNDTNNNNTNNIDIVVVEGPVWAIDIPEPPPIPTIWPPIPYTIYDNNTNNDPDSLGNSGNDGDINTMISGSKLKQLYLTNITISCEGTLWQDLKDNNELINPNDLFNDVEEQFTTDKSILNKVKKPNQISFDSKNNHLNEIKPMKEVIRSNVLDVQRAQNINIMLAKFGKRNYFDLSQAILNFEAEKIGYSIISSLIQFIPSTDETNKINTFILNKYKKLYRKSLRVSIKSNNTDNFDNNNITDTTSTINTLIKRNSIYSKEITIKDIDMSLLIKLKIDKAEQYIFIFSQIKHLEIRLLAMMNYLTIHETNKKIITSSEIILNAVTEIKGSDRLRFLLKSFLDLNNILAKASKSSMECSGIKLESLVKLGQTKTNTGNCFISQ